MSAITSFKILLLLLSILTQRAATDLVPFDDWLYQRVALPDVNIYFRYAGTGPPVLLVHGFPQHSVTAPLAFLFPIHDDGFANSVPKAHVACHRANPCPELHRDRCRYPGNGPVYYTI